MNIFEYENIQFPDLWNKKTISECENYKIPERRENVCFPDVDRSLEQWENKPDEYHLWQGTRIPQWFE